MTTHYNRNLSPSKHLSRYLYLVKHSLYPVIWLVRTETPSLTLWMVFNLN
jgi:hypothetical protein